MASAISTKTTVTMISTAAACGLQVGDMITMPGLSPNKHRHYIVRATLTSADVAHRVRPSRGFARHVRRRKARSRT